MATITTTVPPSGAQHVSKKKKKSLWARAWKSFITSKYITRLWEWFLSLAARLVQPVLFITVMYSMAQTYPGFVSPGKLIDQGAFLLLNGALDIGSFGLPKLAQQALEDGNEEGAKKAIQTGKALFVIMVANLIWGAVEHVFPDIHPAVKAIFALAFTVVRAYYAITYTSVVHALEKPEEEEEEEIAPSEVQAESEQVQSLRAEVQALTCEVQALVQQASSVQVQGQGGAMSEGHLALVGVQEQISEMQDDISEVQDQVQGQLAELLAQLARVQGGAMLPTVVGVQGGAMPQGQGAMSSVAPLATQVQRAKEQSVGAIAQVQQASRETRVQGARVQGVQVKGATSGVQGASDESQVQQPASVEVQGATDEGQLVQHNTEPLHLPVDLQVQGSATPPGYRELIFAYVLRQVQTTDKDPTVKEIQVAVGCSERTAKSYRSAAIAKAREVATYAE